MGQINSSNFQNLLPNIYSEIFNRETNTLIADEIKGLTHERFLQIIAELNRLDSLDEDGKQMVFAVRKGSDKTLLWKTIAEIACIKLDPNSKKVENYRLLTLAELLKVFSTLHCQSAAMDQSVINYNEILANFNDEPDLSTECCICFDRKHEQTLPCTHSFCSKCIEEWNSEHQTCPICREKLNSTDDTWVLSEKPKAEEISEELRLNLMELTDEKETSCSPS